MEFKALGKGVIDITVDSFNLSSIVQVFGRFHWGENKTKQNMLFQHYAKAIEMGSSFQGGMAYLIFICVFPNMF